MKYLRDFNTMNDAKQSTLYSPYVLVIRDEKLVIYENMPHDKDEDFTDIPNNEIWYTTTDGETTQTTHSDGINSLINSMGLSSNVKDGDHCVMRFNKDVTNIEQYAFYGCSGLTSITIPNSVTSIGYGAFSYCRKNLTSFTIPNSVTNIGDWTFSGCSGLTSITIPNSVTNIGEGAFYQCTDLTSITIPNSVTKIENSTFSYCRKLTSSTIPNSVTSIGESAFYECTGLTSVTIPNSVTSIENGTFGGCTGLTSITIPNSVTSIGRSAFEECSGLTSITIGNSMTSIGSNAFWGCSGLTSITIPNSVTNIRGLAFAYCSGLTSITCDALTPPTCGNYCFENVDKTIPLYVPEVSIDLYRVAEGWKDFFHDDDGNDDGNEGTIPNNEIWYTTTDGEITKTTNKIGINSLDSMGYADNVKDGDHCVMRFSKNVTSIGDDAFFECTKLTSITIPNSVTKIGLCAFGGCYNLTSIVVDSGNTKYDSRDNCNAIIETSSNTLVVGCKNTIIPDIVTSIGRDAFWGCFGLTSITIPESVTSIGDYAFYWCTDLKSITIPNSVTNIGYMAFKDCDGLTSVTIGNSVTSIGSSAFSSCTGITSITIPNSVTSIGNMTFYCCTGLTSITIGNSMTSIGRSAFGECSGLTSITCDALTPPTCGNECFYGVDKTIPLYVPETSINLYKVADGWKDFFHDVVITYTASDKLNISENAFGASISSHEFNDGTGVITLDNEDASIRDYAFSGCSGLTSITIPNSVTSIGRDAFSGCDGLTSVTIPNSVTNIGVGVFGHCYRLTSIVVESGNTNYDSRENCNAIIETSTNTLISGCKNTTIPNSVTSIGDHAFSDSNLTSITIPNSVTSIGLQTFYNCHSLTSITIPNSVTSIGRGAFNACFGLISIVVESGNTKFDSRENCNAIIETSSNTLVAGCKNTIIPNSVTSIGVQAFYQCSSLTSITIPNSVTSIGSSAFYYCTGLTSVIIPNSVTNIENYAFSNVKHIEYHGDATGSPWGAQSMN